MQWGLPPDWMKLFVLYSPTKVNPTRKEVNPTGKEGGKIFFLPFSLSFNGSVRVLLSINL